MPAMSQPNIEILVRAEHVCGESPVFDHRNGRLFWVDIPEGKVFYLSENLRPECLFTLDVPVGAVAVRENGGLVLAAKDRFLIVGSDLSTFEAEIAIEEGFPDNRFNDIAVDPQGRLWAGTMDDKEKQNSGALYSLDAKGSVQKHLDNLKLSNGIGWSPDGRTMYLADTFDHSVFAFDFSNDSVGLTNKRTIFEGASDGEYPDGLCVDCDGNIWVAFWAGSKLEKISPTGTRQGVT